MGQYKKGEVIYIEKTTIIIFYYNKEAYAQQIINLVKVSWYYELIFKIYSENIVFIKKTLNKSLIYIK